MVVGDIGEPETFDASGVRRLPVEEIRAVLWIGAVLYVVSGLSILAIASMALSEVAYPGAYVGSGVTLTVAGIASMAIVRVTPQERLPVAFRWVALGLLFAAALAVPLILYFVGFEDFGVGSVYYVLPLVIGFYLLERHLAVALLVTMAVGHAVLLAISDEVVAPIPQFVFLLAAIGSAGVLIGGLVTRLDDAARSEHQAHQRLASLNTELEERVQEQVEELERLGRLRRFLSPQVADAVVSSGAQDFLSPHRREIAVFFCDLRGFTAFAASVEPEEVMSVLDAYYEAVGKHLREHEATVGAISGDGIMAYFNDPTPCERPAEVAVQMACDLRATLIELGATWQRRGYELGVGMGVAFGHATLGVVGFEGRSDYTALGTVVNRAARLCDEARSQQILIDQAVRSNVAASFQVRDLPGLELKGFTGPVSCAEVL